MVESVELQGSFFGRVLLALEASSVTESFVSLLSHKRSYYRRGYVDDLSLII